VSRGDELFLNPGGNEDDDEELHAEQQHAEEG